MDRRSERVAENEVLFRHVNEQIQALDVRLGVAGGDLQGFLCECGDPQCTARVQLSVEEYERFHADPVVFVIVDGHEDPLVETVVERHERFSVIRKDEGGPAEHVAARRTDTAD
jgi:hypothetical protein